jgi:ketosteroid isomerase-like protein
VLFTGPVPLRGKAAVSAWWARHFKDAAAPFSWEPDEVEVLESGALALSSGPVRDSSGKIIARFTSIWRQESPAEWRIIFDNSNAVCGETFRRQPSGSIVGGKS